MNKKLVIYHANCPDGFSSAHIIRQRFPHEDIEFFPGVYQMPPPDVTDRDVIIVDFSYQKDDMWSIIQRASTVTWIDHHASAICDLEEFIPFMLGLRRLDHSGAALTWLYFVEDHVDQMPLLYHYIEDYDLWNFTFPFSKEINAYIQSKDYTFDNWTQLAHELDHETTFLEAKQKGIAIQEKAEKDLKELILQTQSTLNIGGYIVPVCNLPYIFASRAANQLSVNQPFAACYYITHRQTVYFSLRSQTNGLDVSKIAKKMGGGGHPHAAGFEINLNLFLKMMLNQLASSS